MKKKCELRATFWPGLALGLIVAGRWVARVGKGGEKDIKTLSWLDLIIGLSESGLRGFVPSNVAKVVYKQWACQRVNSGISFHFALASVCMYSVYLACRPQWPCILVAAPLATLHSFSSWIKGERMIITILISLKSGLGPSFPFVKSTETDRRGNKNVGNFKSLFLCRQSLIKSDLPWCPSLLKAMKKRKKGKVISKVVKTPALTGREAGSKGQPSWFSVLFPTELLLHS